MGRREAFGSRDLITRHNIQVGPNLPGLPLPPPPTSKCICQGIDCQRRLTLLSALCFLTISLSSFPLLLSSLSELGLRALQASL